MHYRISCQCGDAVTVAETSAGTSIPCHCGRMIVVPAGKTLQVIDEVELDSYVKGVVPSEMPAKWPAQALEAQAVAARSYALANLARDAPFDLFGDGRSARIGRIVPELLHSSIVTARFVAEHGSGRARAPVTPESLLAGLELRV